uniref:Uncharacterized protein n=1 Tax=Arundo donax TaxID=35708 RepID=A0A0A8ZZ13_ARUDO
MQKMMSCERDSLVI